MKLTATLNIFNSKRDLNGNCYWAFEFVDHETGVKVQGTGDTESNVSSITWEWSEPREWCRSIMVNRQELGIREFNRLTKHWEYAGCGSADLAKWIKRKLVSADGFIGKEEMAKVP